MARSIPSGRLDALADTATDIFIAQGYRRTQMADVARAIGLAKGTLYGYVASKRALLRFALEHCDRRGPIPLPQRIPLPAPEPGEISRLFDQRLEREGGMPVLEAALQTEASGAALRRELRAIVCELHGVLRRNRRGIRLLEACSQDEPELQGRWNAQGRVAYRELLTAYLLRRKNAGVLRLVVEPAAVARFVIETVTTWAVHIHYDRFPQAIEEADAQEMVVHFVIAGLLKPPSPDRAGASGEPS